ncbi:hypothetical protein [Salinimicrobium terrae]|uniref:hypothetical protein n=1 Tax=Salinimicrobium terrae TaxID=470866 RepID=UPI000427DC3D|nr:hypothetical protein [Salinimicrobium terrae]
MQKTNISFQYLHRDDGNYKTYGEIIFANREGLSLEEAEKNLRKKLIDSEFFYPSNNGIPFFQEHKNSLYFADWYEFQEFSKTTAEPTDSRDLKIFLSQFKE